MTIWTRGYMVGDYTAMKTMEGSLFPPEEDGCAPCCPGNLAVRALAIYPLEAVEEECQRIEGGMALVYFSCTQAGIDFLVPIFSEIADVYIGMDKEEVLAQWPAYSLGNQAIPHQ